MSNNPPDVELQLTLEEAQFLLRNCESNIHFALMALEAIETRGNLEKTVDLMESFKNIRDKLKSQGVKDS